MLKIKKASPMTFQNDAQADIERSKVFDQAVSEGRTVELGRRRCSLCVGVIQVQASTLQAASQSLKAAYAQHMATEHS